MQTIIFVIGILILTPIILFLAFIFYCVASVYVSRRKFANKMKKRKRFITFAELQKVLDKGTFIAHVHRNNSFFTIWWTPDELVNIYPVLQNIIVNDSYLNDGEVEYHLIFERYLDVNSGTAFFIEREILPKDFFEKYKNNTITLHHLKEKFFTEGLFM